MELHDLVQVFPGESDAAASATDYGFKLIIIGDAGAGKSSFLCQFLEGRFRRQVMHTIGVEFGSKTIRLLNRSAGGAGENAENAGGIGAAHPSGGAQSSSSSAMRQHPTPAAAAVKSELAVKLHIWDTAGQERYRAVTRSYYRGAVGAVVLYDVTSRGSFNHLPNWVRDAREQASLKDLSIIVVGNKKDLADQRQVGYLEAARFAQDSDVLFLETSALTGEGVDDVFHVLSRRVLGKVQDDEQRRETERTREEAVTATPLAEASRGGGICSCSSPGCVTQ